MYRSSYVAEMWGISLETVRIWSQEFASYLSPTATPQKYKQRLFTQEDMQVFALVQEMKKQSATFEEIRGSLENGERGIPPEVSPQDMALIVSGQKESLLAIEVDRLKQLLLDSHVTLKKAQEELVKLRQVQDTNIRLETQLEGADRERERLEMRVQELNKRIEELSLQAGREYTRGFIEALREKGEFPKKNE